MGFIDSIIEKAKSKKKKIVLPESMDIRVLKACDIIVREGIAEVILIGNKDNIMSLYPLNEINNINIIDPNTYSLSNDFVLKLYELRKDKGLSLDEAKNLIYNDYMYFSCMLVHEGYADGVVSGACHSTKNTLSPALRIIKTKPNTELVSAFFLMFVPNCEYGENGTFLFADCGLEQNPTAEKLAEIAKSSAESFEMLTGYEAKIAFLSHSTKGSSKHEDVDKVVDAVNIFKTKYPDIKADGELQLDAAIVPEVKKLKAPDSDVAGCANVLIFPDLDAGNIGYKLVQRLAKAEAYGPICQGIKAPINDLSRGCSTADIVGVVAITAVQAQNIKSTEVVD